MATDERHLQALGPHLPGSQRYASPLRGRTISQIADVCEHGQVKESAAKGKANHRNAEPIGVKPIQCRTDRGADGQGADADRDPKP